MFSGGALDCVKCSDADTGLPPDAQLDKDCSDMPFIPCKQPTSKEGGFREDWSVFCSKIDGHLTTFFPRKGISYSLVDIFNIALLFNVKFTVQSPQAVLKYGEHKIRVRASSWVMN